MKIKLTYLLLFITLYACKTKKESNLTQNMNTQTQSQRSANNVSRRLDSQDSSYRYWYYAGDSTFFFHPDLGLWSQSGQFTYMYQNGSQTREETIRHQYDSLGRDQTNWRQDKNTQWTTYFMRSWFWLLLVGILVAVYWIIKNRINLR